MQNYTIHDSMTSRYHFYPEDYTNFTTQETHPTHKNIKETDWLDEIKRKNELAIKIAIETEQKCNNHNQLLTRDIFRLVGQVNTIKNEVKQLRDELDYLKRK